MVKDLYSMSSVSVTTIALHQHTEVVYPFNPTQWQVLDFIDAMVTEKYIEGYEIHTHELSIDPNFEMFIKKSRTNSLFNLVTGSYLQSLNNAGIVPTERFGKNSSFTEMAVISRGNIIPKTIIPGLKGFLAKIFEEELLEDMSFSVFAPTNGYKNTSVMLGLASFINHDCDPIGLYIVEGEKSSSTVAIQSNKPIGVGEEITVMETIIFEKATKCRWVGCKQASSLDLTPPLFETFVAEVSADEMSCEVPAEKVSADVCAPEVSAARTLCLQKSPPKDNICETDTNWRS